MSDAATDQPDRLTGPMERERVLATLRAHAGELRRRGIRRLYLYGSLARGTHAAESDIDLYAVIEPGARWNLLSLASAAARLEDLLGRPVDFADIDTLRPGVREAAERDAVDVLA